MTIEHNIGDEVFYIQDNKIKTGIVEDYFLKRNVYQIKSDNIPAEDIDTVENLKTRAVVNIDLKISDLEEEKTLVANTKESDIRPVEL